MTGLEDDQKAASALKKCDQESRNDHCDYGLVVDGASLQILMDNMKEDFLSVCLRCTAVVCCRMSPRQKAETVRLVKKSKANPVCAAIGDGANDVSMIQEAQIGFGIMGKEGRQAVRCADFAFARFRFLKRVLLLHGHWFYARVTTLVQYSFYKNVTFITPQSVYESLALTVYNITFTFLPILVYGLFDQNLPPDLLMSRPHLYKLIANNANMSWRTFFKWNAFALWHTSVMYFGLFFLWFNDAPGFSDGTTADLYLFGTALMNICVYVVNFKIFLEARYFTHFFVWSVVLTLVFYAVQNLLYHGLIIDLLENYEIYWSYFRLHESAVLMLASLLLGVVCLLPDFVNTALVSNFDERAQEKRRRRRKSTRSVSLKAYITQVNEAFDPMEGERSLWETTKRPATYYDSVKRETQDHNGIRIDYNGTSEVNCETTSNYRDDSNVFTETHNNFTLPYSYPYGETSNNYNGSSKVYDETGSDYREGRHISIGTSNSGTGISTTILTSNGLSNILHRKPNSVSPEARDTNGLPKLNKQASSDRITISTGRASLGSIESEDVGSSDKYSLSGSWQGKSVII
ncbi:putative phospholipid-transporting ATPase IF [Halocaridina rubra]|uniref:Phospholipid-transporting ATPase IF n=1 Tax=Halocaridina rubra TaxID=373956 RepID=A0AAN8X9Y9_HALRR